METRSHTRKRKIAANEHNVHTQALTIAVAKILQSNNFASTTVPVLNLLTKIAEKILTDLASKSKSIAEISQRSELLDQDVMIALKHEKIDLEILNQSVFQNKQRVKMQKQQKLNHENMIRQNQGYPPKKIEDEMLEKNLIDAVKLPLPQSPPEINHSLPIGPKKKAAISSHVGGMKIKTIPDLPDLHTFKRTSVFVHNNENYDFLRTERADKKWCTLHNLASFMARGKYYNFQSTGSDLVGSGQDDGAVALFDGQEAGASGSKNEKIDLENQTESEKQVDIFQQKMSEKWEILPCLLANKSKNSSVSVYAQALIPTMTETERMIRQDPFLAKKKPLRPKKETKKIDGRSRNARQNRLENMNANR